MALTATATTIPTSVSPNQTFTVNVALVSDGATTLVNASLILPNAYPASVSPCFRPGQAVGVGTTYLNFQVTLFDTDYRTTVVPIDAQFTTADGAGCALQQAVLVSLLQAFPSQGGDRGSLLFDRIYIDDVSYTGNGHLAWLC